jgi:hypothetical protein
VRIRQREGLVDGIRVPDQEHLHAASVSQLAGAYTRRAVSARRRLE